MFVSRCKKTIHWHFSVSCWEDRCSVDEPIAYFENENYPQRNEPEADSIKYTVKITDENVCQVR